MKRKAAKKLPPPPKKAQKRTPSTKRISQQRRLRPVIRRTLLGGALVLLLVGSALGFWLWRQGYVHQAWQGTQEKVGAVVDRFSFAAGLTLKTVRVEGHRVLTTGQVLNATGLNPKVRYGLLRLSADAVREQIEQLEFVKKAEVQKQFPDTLMIRITEREPVAFWQSDAGISLLDSEGVVLSPPRLGAFAGLPVVVGENAAFHAKALFDFLITEPSLFSRVRGMSLIEDRRWNIVLKNNIIIKLPEQKPEQAWATLARLEQQRQLLSKPIKIIDLRLPDKVYILPIRKAAPSSPIPQEPE